MNIWERCKVHLGSHISWQRTAQNDTKHVFSTNIPPVICLRGYSNRPRFQWQRPKAYTVTFSHRVFAAPAHNFSSSLNRSFNWNNIHAVKVQPMLVYLLILGTALDQSLVLNRCLEWTLTTTIDLLGNQAHQKKVWSHLHCSHHRIRWQWDWD